MSSIPIDVQRRFEQRWACRFNRSPAPRRQGNRWFSLRTVATGNTCQHATVAERNRPTTAGPGEGWSNQPE
jgi:hypothetical protein